MSARLTITIAALVACSASAHAADNAGKRMSLIGSFVADHKAQRAAKRQWKSYVASQPALGDYYRRAKRKSGLAILRLGELGNAGFALGAGVAALATGHPQLAYLAVAPLVMSPIYRGGTRSSLMQARAMTISAGLEKAKTDPRFSPSPHALSVWKEAGWYLDNQSPWSPLVTPPPIP